MTTTGNSQLLLLRVLHLRVGEDADPVVLRPVEKAVHDNLAPVPDLA